MTEILTALVLLLALAAPAVAAVRSARADGYGRRRDPRSLPGAQFWERPSR